MKQILVLVLLIFCTLSYSQETDATKIIEINENSAEVPFAIIENVPLYKGCDANLSNQELKDCMSKSIANHVSKNFNLTITNGLGLPDGNVRINVLFKIDKEGNIVDIKSRAPHPALEEETIRVIKLIPKMDKPGYQKGKPVAVPYSLPIVFKIVNPKKVKDPRE